MLFQFLHLNSGNFLNLTNLICHLLIGGQFQVVEILYSPGSVDYRLSNEIQNNCSEKIQWVTSDITQPREPLSAQKISLDHYVQLIFPDPNLDFKSLLSGWMSSYYRIFVFHFQIDESIIVPRSVVPLTNSIALLHNSANDSIQAFLLDDDLNFLNDNIQINNNQSEALTSSEVFESVFGTREQMRVFGVSDTIIACNSEILKLTKAGIFSQIAETFFYTQMNMTFIKRVCPGFDTEYFRHIGSKSIYNDLTWELEQITINASIEQNTNILFLNTNLLSFFEQIKDATKLLNYTALNCIFQYNTAVVFVYGDDFPLQNIQRNFFQFLVGAWIYLTLIISAMAILFLIRHGDMNRRDMFISVYMDIMIAFTNGSTLRYENHLEKIFFMILLFAAFFINTIALDNFLFFTFLTEEPNRIDSIEKYIEFNPPTQVRGDKDLFSSRFGANAKTTNQSVYELIEQKDSYGFVTKTIFLEAIQIWIEYRNAKKLDVLPERLDEDYRYYYLSYNGYAPKLAVEKFNRALTLYIESGIESFHSSYADFLSKIRLRVENGEIDDDEDQPKPLRLDQLYFFFAIYGIQISIAIVAFIIEIVIHRKRSRQAVAQHDV